ncbi:MAG: hypothetical protein KKA51_07625 [Nanoarchaeota archaeon]|nr:hypothetical protein [Nanoarchaeota archaeon]MBU1269619.1 hypothetical protein [Nanoarchaeota archaeon]MBU2443249.1 hypothetical protein [Nanoarchaeota archaeon]
MTNLTVSSSRTIEKKIKTAAYLLAGGLIAVYGTLTINKSIENGKFEDRVKYVQQLAEKHQFEPAEKLFEEYTEQKLLRPEDKLKIKTIIKNEKEEYTKEQEQKKVNKQKETDIAGFESKLEKSLKDAEVELEKIKATGIYSQNETKSLEHKIYSHTEDGLRQAWQKGDNKEEAYKKYLSAYPQGPYRKEAIKNLILTEINSLGKQYEENKFAETYANLEELNKNLKKYESEGISLKGLTDENDFFYKTVIYAYRIFDINTNTEILIGDKVKFTKQLTWSFTSYDTERNNIIPLESEGIVVGYYKDYKVRFDNIKEFPWTDDWDMKEYWKDGKKNVAKFNIEELTKIPQMTEFDKKQLLKHAEEIRTSMEAYTSR